jgi:putative colanic acid biosynthesis acetyltransferase WcaF
MTLSQAVDLSSYKNPPGHNKGRGILTRVTWHVLNALFIQSAVNPFSGMKVALLKAFGATIGRDVLLKPGINVKHPWFLTIGDHCWIGENAWFDNTFAPITIGANVVISQGVYLCTGNHDWTDPSFGLIEKPLTIEDGAWLGAQSRVLPGAYIAENVVIGGGSVISKPTEPNMVYVGNPAAAVKKRVIGKK